MESLTEAAGRCSEAQQPHTSVCPHGRRSGSATPAAALAQNRTRSRSRAEKADLEAASNLPDSKLVSSRGRMRIHSSCGFFFFPFLFVQRPVY